MKKIRLEVLGSTYLAGSMFNQYTSWKLSFAAVIPYTVQSTIITERII